MLSRLATRSRVVSRQMRGKAATRTFISATTNKTTATRSASRLPAAARVTLPKSSSVRLMSTTSSEFDLETWTSDFLKAIEDVPAATDPAKSSLALRKLVKTGLLKFTDMSENPEKFFLAHRILAQIGLGGFGIRFTVQFNLFAGSMVGLAGPEQLTWLDDIQKKGQLGCFLLTEMQAGVLSGLIVETTCDWDPDTQEFVLHTPNDKAAKNWISQGYTAELGVVIADLRIKGKSHGPHPFFIQLRDDQHKLMPGIRIEDMGTKTVANDLDNARVWFDKVRLPKNAILNKFADIKDNEYVQVGDERMRIEVIGQRLLTGRQAIAEAALISAKVLHMKTEKYALKKVCNGLDGERSLASMPQLKAVFDESYKQIDEMIGFVAAIEDKLNICLKTGTIPHPDLVDAISVCKIRAIEVSIQRCHALRLEVGSYALMHNTGFELMDMFLCCKFAEGDSRILQMKLARDRLKKARKDGGVGTAMKVFGSDGLEALTTVQLATDLAPAGRDLTKLSKAMDDNFETVYKLANYVEERIMKNTTPSKFIEPCVERMLPASTDFDEDWINKVQTKV